MWQPAAPRVYGSQLAYNHFPVRTHWKTSNAINLALVHEMKEMKAGHDYCWLFTVPAAVWYMALLALLRPVNNFIINPRGGAEFWHLQNQVIGETPAVRNYTINHIIFMSGV